MRKAVIFILLLAVAGGGYALWARRTGPGPGGRQIFILGCDGMDPRLVRRMMDEGRLPNFARLAARGGFSPLETSIPPQSPVAWSNFITGAGPGEHGIFDFIHRQPRLMAAGDPNRFYFSTNRIHEEVDEPWFTFKMDGREYQVPDISTDNQLLRRGTPFWDYLDERGIPVKMYKLPANYPPSESKHGHMCCLSDMGVPDAFGTQGTFQHFTSEFRQKRNDVGGGILMRIDYDRRTGVQIARLVGPETVFRPKSKLTLKYEELVVPIEVHPDPERNVAKLVFVNEAPIGIPNERVELVLNAGEWSDWTEVHFLQTPLGPDLPTMVRFYLQAVHPDLKLYVSPLNFIPTNAAQVISEPPDWVTELGEAIGPFYTQGFAEDFKAAEHVFTDEEYRVQADLVFEERLRLLDYVLDHLEDGVTFFYFSSTDLQSHIFWWEGDEPHPLRSPEEAKKYQGVIETLYTRVDAALGRIMDRLDDRATLIVMSDHGFGNFRRGFGLNTWLRQEGYLVCDHHGLDGADWSKTKAYGLGLNGVFLNLKGREDGGIVEPGAEGEGLLKEITEKLLAVRDPQNGRPVIHRVYRTDKVYKGPYSSSELTPDLITGYERDYRASWSTCLGGLDQAVVVDNKKPWSADHCIAHDLVPGILITNRKITKEDPSLIDIAPTILGEFGIATPASMHGRDLFRSLQAAANQAKEGA